MKIDMLQAAPLPLGAYTAYSGICFALDVKDRKDETKLFIMNKSTGETLCEVVMNDYPAAGNICSVLVRGLRADRICYRYERSGKPIEDIYAMKVHGSRPWGSMLPLKERYVYDVYKPEASWADDVRPSLDWSEMILYKLHVRGFTKHNSSGVSRKGTFSGIAQKADYFKELGVNTLVLMPVTEFAEVYEKKTESLGRPAYIKDEIPEEKPKTGYNSWGYGQAQFFIPKSAYAYRNPQAEFCDMIKTLHAKGIAVIIEMLFPDTMPRMAILDCLRFWAVNYHVDGFWLNQEIVPMQLAATDPVLADVKIISGGFDTNAVYGKKIPESRRFAVAVSEFKNTVRCYLKGDENCISSFTNHLTVGNPYEAVIHSITDNNGFTLNDLVTYNVKHNEANGEDNRDGSNDNHSWNCGVEGKTRNKTVLNLRRRQKYNAMLFLLLSQGVPMIYGGDEFGNSQQGNNNAYCQDNDIFWLNWRDLKKNAQMFDFVKRVIALRKEHPVLRPKKELRRFDYLSSGFPDMSLHGVQPWKLMYQREDRYVGVMYSGKYAKMNGREDASFYIAYNMHWEPEYFSIPVLPKNQKWEKIADTFYEDPFNWKAESDPEREEKMLKTSANAEYMIEPRSIQIFMSTEKSEKLVSEKKPALKFKGKLMAAKTDDEKTAVEEKIEEKTVNTENVDVNTVNAKMADDGTEV